MNEPGVSGALGVPFRFRELESAFGGCITLGSIEIWDSAFFLCFIRVMVLFPLSLLPDPFFNGLCDVGLFWIFCCCVGFVVVFSYCMGTRALFLSHSFFSICLGRICISGHCKLVFLLWSWHGGASTARLKFCLTICVFHQHLHTLVLFLLCLFCVRFIYSSSLYHFWSFIKHSTSPFNGRVILRVSGLGLVF